MAWEELLKLHERRDDNLSQTGEQEARDKGSLIQQAAAMIGQSEAEALIGSAEANAFTETVQCADGYERRSPVQIYLTAEDYNRRRIRKAILIVLGVVLAVLLVMALAKTGLLRLR